MKDTIARFLSAAACFLFAMALTGDDRIPTGPETEKRFPPLQVPESFKGTLFACDPLIEYPSVIAVGPKRGSLFVAIDYMTGLGHDIVRRDEIRLIEDTNNDDYADKATVVAAGFNSIQGIAYDNGVIFVMHAPYLSAVTWPPHLTPKGRGVRGEGGERRDLLSGLGLPPEKDQIRLHNANGVTIGHDGWLYLSLGDRGCSVVRPEGDTLTLEGGGILRCRPDGRDLHVFATGLRNIYDVALDDELNVFVRDNENDGGTYKVRLCHSFFGADHGYPYRYEERPEEALPPLADLGLGSSAGGVAYLEKQFPAEYHGNLFFCEWGRAVVRYRPTPAGSGFAPLKEIAFAASAGSDTYGFKPTDVVVDRDGSLFISDWADGQRPKRGRGRIYHVRHTSGTRHEPPPFDSLSVGRLVELLDSPSYFERCQAQQAIERMGKKGLEAVELALSNRRLGVAGQLHAVWLIARLAADAKERLFTLAESSTDGRVQAQALRALADLTDPVLLRHRLVTEPGAAADAARMAAIAAKHDSAVLRETVVALGRLRWRESPVWMRQNLSRLDAPLAHSAQWTMRQSANWPVVLDLVDLPDDSAVRPVALRAAAQQFEPTLVAGVIERLHKESQPQRQLEYADLLSRVYKKPGPRDYWGFRPKPRPANEQAWEHTEAIAMALDGALGRANPSVRIAMLQRLRREQVPVNTSILAGWLKDERDGKKVAAIIDAITDRPAGETRALFEAVLRSPQHSIANRRAATAHFVRELDAVGEQRLLAAAAAVEDGPVLGDLLLAIGKRKLASAARLLESKIKSSHPDVRAAAVTALVEMPAPPAPVVAGLLDDQESVVRSAAALAAGNLKLHKAADRLLNLARDANADVRRASLDALRRLRDQRGLPVAVAALDDRDTALKALEFIADLGSPEQAPAIVNLARRQPEANILTAVGKVLAAWIGTEKQESIRRDLKNALAEIHGSSGQVLAWRVLGPLPADKLSNAAAAGRLVQAAGIDARATFGVAATADSTWLAQASVAAAEQQTVEFFTASTGLETISLNGKIVFKRDRPGVIGPYPDRFEATLAKGVNRLEIRLRRVKGAAQLLFRFRRKSTTPEHERLTLASLSRAGNPAHGREIFHNDKKSQCIKCHRVGAQGERIGPDLTGLGNRFPKIYIIESILQPSRTIAPSFESTTLVLSNGTVLHGIKIAEDSSAVTLVDNQAQKHLVPRSTIDEQLRHPQSTMPDTLERQLTEDEFVDLVSYLVNLKE